MNGFVVSPARATATGSDGHSPEPRASQRASGLRRVRALRLVAWMLASCFAASCGGATGSRPREASREHVAESLAEEVALESEVDPEYGPDSDLEPEEELDAEMLAIDLARTERARDMVAAYGPEVRVEHGHGNVEHLWLEREGGRALLCVRPTADATYLEPGVLCFEASGEPPRVELGLVDEEDPSRGYHLCIGDHVMTWPSGAPRAGTCLGGSREGRPLSPSPYASAPAPARLESLGLVTVHTLPDPRLITITGEATTLLCFRASGRLECAAMSDPSPPRWTTALVSEADAGGRRWIAWVREQFELGSCPDQQNASLSVVLVRHEGTSAQIHGVLPLGGWDDEVGPAGDDVIVPFPTHLAAVHPTGCLEVVVPAEHRIVDCRGNQRPAWRHPHPQRAPERVRGLLADVFEGIALDFSGAWMPAQTGAFHRVPSCPTH